MRKYIYVVMLVVVLAVPQARCEEKGFQPELGFSLVISPDYKDTLEKAYSGSEVSGGYGWMGLNFGLRYQVAEQVVVIPRLGLLFNYVLSVGGGDSFANTIIQPAIAGRYLFKTGPSFFIEGEISHNTVNTGSEAFDTDGGIGYAAIVGYQWENNFDISGGYSVLPTDVSYGGPFSEEMNFGGVEFRFRGKF